MSCTQSQHLGNVEKKSQCYKELVVLLWADTLLGTADFHQLTDYGKVLIT